MRTLESIISEAAESQQAAIREAFEAGRAIGQQAADDLREKLAELLSVNQTGRTAHPDPVEPAPKTKAETPKKRAPTGSVKPAIVKVIAESPKGVTADEIVGLTGFKPNSVRGTLWTLNNEGTIVKRQGRWFPSSSPEGEAEGVAPSAHH